MEPYTFATAIPATAAFDFEIPLFNVEAHRNLQRNNGWRSFYVIDSKTTNISAALHLNVEGGKASSPVRAPFGSVAFSKSLPSDILDNFVVFILSQLKATGVSHIRMINPPSAYQRRSSILTGILINRGFTISRADVSACIRITAKAYQAKIHHSKNKKLRQAEKANLTFQQVPVSEVDRIYTFIQNCRVQKDYRLSMSLSELKKTVAIFPDRFLLFEVRSGETVVAGAIAIRVRTDVLYQFYHDHDQGYDKFTPIVFLLNGMYAYCQKEKIKLLDLGTSSNDGVMNHSLLNFKLMVGAAPYHKFTFEKAL